MKIGITGQAGFVGTHLYNFLNIQENTELITFRDDFFSDEIKLSSFVKSCDVIVHLAAMNRHDDPQVIYDTNIQLVQALINAMEKEDVQPHILFSSSTQEDNDNLYGQSKKDGRILFEQWANKVNAKFTAMIVPNVFGPFGRPNYNSVVATFCHKLTHGETPEIHVDGSVKLIYVQELANEFFRAICGEIEEDNFRVPYSKEIKVSEILSLLKKYKQSYFANHTFPELNGSFEINLFNTFRSYFDLEKHYPVKLVKHSDPRGSFVETVKLEMGGQVSFSTTVPGITRGNHYHTRKIERFAVIKGKALIQLRRIGSDEVLDFYLDGDEPAFVDMPVWYTHNIKNIGEEELLTIFWINEFFDPNDSDTYFEEA